MKRKELYLELSDFYQKKRDFFRNAIQSSRFKLLKCEGTYFQLATYSRISEEKDTEFVRRMTRDMGVAAIPVSVFYPIPAYRQKGYLNKSINLPNTEKLCKTVLSLPMHTALDETTLSYICDNILSFFKK